MAAKWRKQRPSTAPIGHGPFGAGPQKPQDGGVAGVRAMAFARAGEGDLDQGSLYFLCFFPSIIFLSVLSITFFWPMKGECR